VVCLVPSTTDTLLEFGLVESLVGVTEYCQIDATTHHSPQRVGGTKTPDTDKILSLKPDLIIANQEENDQESLETIADEGIPIWLSFPKSTEQAIADLWTLVRVFNRERELAPRINMLERSLEWTRLASFDRQQVRYFCPIWKDANAGWWMTFNQDTYANDVLACCGGENIFSQRERRYPIEADIGESVPEEPGERDLRYPRVTNSEILEADPELILLPDEPYAFGSQEVREISDLIAGTTAVSKNQVYLIDGRLITWHGIRIAEAINKLPRYFETS
jgi:ABC-type Fe3+-hydroxamate transport system substrate-binding protein